MTLHKKSDKTPDQLQRELDELIVERVAILSDDTQADQHQHSKYCQVLINEFGEIKGLNAIQLYMIYNNLNKVDI
jgi:hypothetical protein